MLQRFIPCIKEDSDSLESMSCVHYCYLRSTIYRSRISTIVFKSWSTFCVVQFTLRPPALSQVYDPKGKQRNH